MERLQLSTNSNTCESTYLETTNSPVDSEAIENHGMPRHTCKAIVPWETTKFDMTHATNITANYRMTMPEQRTLLIQCKLIG